MTIFYITKYALTAGIQARECEEPSPGFPHMITYRERYPQNFHGEGKDWHRTKKGAARRAREMQEAKIASLRKQIAKLERMEF